MNALTFRCFRFWTLMHVLDERSPLTLEIEELPPVADRHASERNDIPLFEVTLHDGPGADHRTSASATHWDPEFAESPLEQAGFELPVPVAAVSL